MGPSHSPQHPFSSELLNLPFSLEMTHTQTQSSECRPTAGLPRSCPRMVCLYTEGRQEGTMSGYPIPRFHCRVFPAQHAIENIR